MMRVGASSEGMQKIVLKLMGHARYRALDSLQVWRGTYKHSDAQYWCLILFDRADRSSLRILKSLFDGLKTSIEPASQPDVQTAIDSRQSVIWCFSDCDLHGCGGQNQANQQADDASFDTLSVGRVKTPLVLLPTVDEIKRSAEIKQKLWQYFLHLK
tara:strand:+ start:2301 stop:2771 length:471 start_codon:yes stop_codon:yes gene_type:complete